MDKHVVVHTPIWCVGHDSYSCLCFPRDREFIEYTVREGASMDNAERALGLSKEFSRRYLMALAPEFEKIIKQAIDEACAEASETERRKNWAAHSELWKAHTMIGLHRGLSMAAEIVRSHCPNDARGCTCTASAYREQIEARARELEKEK